MSMFRIVDRDGEMLADADSLDGVRKRKRDSGRRKRDRSDIAKSGDFSGSGSGTKREAGQVRYM